MSKKEVARLEKERMRLEKFMSGIKDMDGLPGAVFIMDTKKEKIAVREARKLGIPSVAIVDTNCDPDEIDYVIPCNDDAIRAIRLITERVAHAVLEGTRELEIVKAEEQEGIDEALEEKPEEIKAEPKAKEVKDDKTAVKKVVKTEAKPKKTAKKKEETVKKAARAQTTKAKTTKPKEETGKAVPKSKTKEEA